MPAAVIAGGAIVGGMMQADAAKSAAGAQASAADRSTAEQRRQYDQTRADQAPFREVGVNANNRLAQLMGLSSGGADNGMLSRNFTMADLQSDPVYNSGLQFGLDEGVKGINNQAAATGSMLSGATLKALTRFGNDYGTTKAGDAYNRFNNNNNQLYNRFAGLSGAGQQATNAIGSAGQNMANNVSQTQLGLGNARAASAIGTANGWTNALNQGINSWQGQNAMDRMFPKTWDYSGN